MTELGYRRRTLMKSHYTCKWCTDYESLGAAFYTQFDRGSSSSTLLTVLEDDVEFLPGGVDVSVESDGQVEGLPAAEHGVGPVPVPHQLVLQRVVLPRVLRRVKLHLLHVRQLGDWGGGAARSGQVYRLVTDWGEITGQVRPYLTGHILHVRQLGDCGEKPGQVKLAVYLLNVRQLTDWENQAR